MSNTCPICFEVLIDKIRASTDVCDHVFCLPCLEKWSRHGSFCPVDRKRFRKIINLDKEDVIQVKPRKKKKSRVLYDVSVYCEICKQPHNAQTLLLCDCCDLGFHCECLSPPLTDIPAGQWYCPACAAVDVRIRQTQEPAKGLQNVVEDQKISNDIQCIVKDSESSHLSKIQTDINCRKENEDCEKHAVWETVSTRGRVREQISDKDLYIDEHSNSSSLGNFDKVENESQQTKKKVLLTGLKQMYIRELNNLKRDIKMIEDDACRFSFVKGPKDTHIAREQSGKSVEPAILKQKDNRDQKGLNEILDIRDCSLETSIIGNEYSVPGQCYEKNTAPIEAKQKAVNQEQTQIKAGNIRDDFTVSRINALKCDTSIPYQEQCPERKSGSTSSNMEYINELRNLKRVIKNIEKDSQYNFVKSQRNVHSKQNQYNKNIVSPAPISKDDSDEVLVTRESHLKTKSIIPSSENHLNDNQGRCSKKNIVPPELKKKAMNQDDIQSEATLIRKDFTVNQTNYDDFILKSPKQKKLSTILSKKYKKELESLLRETSHIGNNSPESIANNQTSVPINLVKCKKDILRMTENNRDSKGLNRETIDIEDYFTAFKSNKNISSEQVRRKNSTSKDKEMKYLDEKKVNSTTSGGVEKDHIKWDQVCSKTNVSRSQHCFAKESNILKTKKSIQSKRHNCSQSNEVIEIEDNSSICQSRIRNKDIYGDKEQGIKCTDLAKKPDNRKNKILYAEGKDISDFSVLPSSIARTEQNNPCSQEKHNTDTVSTNLVKLMNSLKREMESSKSGTNACASTSDDSTLQSKLFSANEKTCLEKRGSSLFNKGNAENNWSFSEQKQDKAVECNRTIGKSSYPKVTEMSLLQKGDEQISGNNFKFTSTNNGCDIITIDDAVDNVSSQFSVFESIENPSTSSQKYLNMSVIKESHNVQNSLYLFNKYFAMPKESIVEEKHVPSSCKATKKSIFCDNSEHPDSSSNPTQNFHVRQLHYAIKAKMNLAGDLKKIEQEQWTQYLKKRKHPLLSRSKNQRISKDSFVLYSPINSTNPQLVN